MTPPQGHLVTTGEFKTHYLDVGEGQPVILLHGGGAGADGWSNWQGVLPQFAERVRALVVDLVGFGHSDKPDPATFTYDQDARNRQLIDFIEELALERVAIVGNSMGGCTALGVAQARPDLIDSLVLMGSAGLASEISPALNAIVHYDFTEDGMRKVVASLTNPAFVPDEEQVRYRYQLSIEPDTRAAYVATMAWVRDHGLHYPEADIAKIKARTLVVNGKDDRIIPLATAFKYLELLENSTGYILPHCGHWAMIEHPDLFTRATLDFITAE